MGVWRTIGGRRVYIEDGEDLETAMKRSGKFAKIKEEESLKDKVITSEEHNQKVLDNQKKYDEIKEEYDKNQAELLQQYKDGKMTDEEWRKKDLDLWDNYNRDIRQLRTPSIYDAKKDTYLHLDKNTVFKDNNKEFKGAKNGEFTDNEKLSLTHYTSQWGYGSYNDVNSVLYEKQIYGDKAKVEESIHNIDTAMSKSKIGGNYQLYRGIEPSRLNNEEVAKAVTKINKAIQTGHINGGLEKNLEIIEKLKGTTIENKGFVSTSTYLDPNYTKRGVTLVIDTNSNDRAIDIRNLSKYNGQQDKFLAAFSKGPIQVESEVLYDRNTDFKIKDVAITTDGIFLYVDTEQKRKK